MSNCFLCCNKYDSIEYYVKHLKFHHKLTSTSSFHCSNCKQMFQSIYSFKRHLNRTHHSDFNINNNSNYNILNLNENENKNETNFEIKSSSPLPEITSEKAFDKTNNNVFIENNNMISSIQDEIIKFAAKYYGKIEISRKLATEIIDDVQNVIVLPLVNYFTQDCHAHINKNKSENIFSSVNKVFETINTEIKFKNYLKELNLFEEPKQFVIENSMTIFNLNQYTTKGTLLPIRQNLKQVFELPNILNSMMQNYKICQKNVKLCNIVQGCVWKKKTSNFGDKIVLPYILYQDEFEINNPLGSKRGVHKISAFYLAFPLLNPNEVSKLENIFPCCLTRSLDMKFGLQQNVNNLISELKFLEESGIDIEHDGESKRVHLILSAITGDNLGLNSVLGLTKCFQANYFCRLCKGHKNKLKFQYIEDRNMLRNEQNYKEDLALNDLASTGIKEMCPFNAIESFFVTDNFVADVMHDIFEGICHVEISQILENFIYEKQFFSLADLNSKKKDFVHDKSDANNLCSDISQGNIKNKSLKMSASEMQCFVHYMPLYIGEYVPRNYSVWKFLMSLLKLISLCMKTSFDENDITELQNVIENHHKTYVSIFKTALLPKHHFITHYPTIIRKMGPVRKLWCMRFEAKHKELKKYASSITSRKNICLSLATKLQFSLVSNLLNRKAGINLNSFKVGSGEVKDLSEILKTEGSLESEDLTEVYCSDSILICNTLYKINDVITLEISGLYSFFSLICSFETSKKKEHFILCKKIKVEKYDSHYDSYIIHDIGNEYKLFSINDIKYPPVNILNIYGHFKAIKTKPAFA